ncbi:MAG TPA: hypothetical protein VGJ79_01390 [Candidatus Dormibacteraeota bacterium]|jgi:hypothetical protein
MAARWTRDVASSSGQVFEFRLWSALVEQSAGQLHIFLPLSDRGIDAIVHRLSDGTYSRVQAKGRSSLIGGEVRLAVWATALVDDDALLISGLIVEGGLGPTMLAVPVREFKRLAEKTSADGDVVYSMSFGMRPRSRSRWFPFLVPTERLVERFGLSRAVESGAEEAPVESRPSWRSDLGFLGESEAMRLLAAIPDLNLFRPFPDLETAELLALNLETRRVIGMQIKTTEVDFAHPTGTVKVLASSFRTSPTTYFVVFAWRRDEKRFFDACLLIPSEDVRNIAQPMEVSGHLKFDWHPGSSTRSRLDGYRLQLSDLGSHVKTLCSS